MIPLSIKIAGQLATASLVLLAGPARASPPGTPAAIAALGLSGQQISLKELGGIRGGFDLAPSLSISFAFKQIEAINGIVVKSIMVPETNLTGAASSASTIAGVGTSRSASTPSVTVTDANGNTQTITPSANNTINLTATGNNGQTVINTQLGSSGLNNITTNVASNTAVSVAATLNIGISGLSQFLTQQQSFANTQSGLYYAGSAFK